MRLPAYPVRGAHAQEMQGGRSGSRTMATITGHMLTGLKKLLRPRTDMSMTHKYRGSIMDTLYNIIRC